MKDLEMDNNEAFNEGNCCCKRDSDPDCIMCADGSHSDCAKSIAPTPGTEEWITDRSPEFSEEDIKKFFSEIDAAAIATAPPHRETLQEKRIRTLEERNTTLGREYASVSDALARVLDLAKDWEEAGFAIIGYQIRAAISTNPIPKAGE